MRRFYILALTLLVTGCAQLIGLDERETVAGDASVLDANLSDADGKAASDAGELSCDRYCALALDRCKAEQGVQLFPSLDRCLAVCEAYPKGDANNPVGDTLACRLSQLDKLAPGDVLEAPTYCPAAGPGGGAATGEGPNAACGTNCEGYCRLRQICPGEGPKEECLRRCPALADLGTYNAGADFGGGADNLQCRLAHLSAAADYGRQNKPDDLRSHCSHSNIKSSVTCDLNKDQLPACADYCRLVLTACSDPSVRQFDTQAQCEALCSRLTPGTKLQLAEDTVRCRREYAYQALAIAATPTFCEAAGPAPAQCGRGKCANYCALARSACQTGFDAKFPGATPAESLSKCEADCAKIPDSQLNAFFAIGERATGDTFNCRVRNTAVAFGDARACDSALGLNTPASVCKL